MRRIFIAASSALIAFTVSGCVTVSESDYKLGRDYLAENPRVKRELINDCIADRKRESLGERTTLAALINVSVAAYPETICRRIINAYANGRLTYRDIQGINSSTADNSRIIRIIQGK